MLMIIGRMSQLADDIADGDAPPRQVVDLLMLIFGRLAVNPFWQRHAETLAPLVASSVLMWSATDDWARSPRETAQMFGFVFREIGEQIVSMTAFLIGGADHAATVTREVHNFYHGDGRETFAEWRKEIEA